MKIAVIGAGIAGLGAAWLLARSQGASVTVFEKENRLGGHANTIDIVDDAGRVPIDTGFIVYNTANYPNLIALFDHLDVPTAPTRMSFAVSLQAGAYEYSGSGLYGLFGQPTNLARPSHLAMVRDLLRFFRDARLLAAVPEDRTRAGEMTLGRWLQDGKYSRSFIDRHILPMGAAIWSAPANRLLDFPAASFARFFDNHGLLQARNRPAWRTVDGGSREYVQRMTADMPAVAVQTAMPIAGVTRDDANDGVVVTTADGAEHVFDACVMACHADVSLSLLRDADAVERQTLAAFRYSQNEAVLHTDTAQMPKRRRLWSSWNYVSPESASDDLTVTYWMNALQPLRTQQDWFVTLNPSQTIAQEHVHSRHAYAHPVFDADAISNQPRLWALQGRRKTWFCGSYFGYGFHEDALQSGLAAAEDLAGVPRPWSRERQNDRLSLPPGWTPGASRAPLPVTSTGIS